MPRFPQRGLISIAYRLNAVATRPVFTPELSGPELYSQVDVDFTWFPGFSNQQKQKSIRSLHREASEQGIEHLLEISTKSEARLGRRLSAFNLRIAIDPEVSVESAYQGSKVFKNGGPYQQLYYQSSYDAKTDDRLRSSGKLVAFELKGERWPLEPKTAFYDWLYLKALTQYRGLVEKLLPYRGFTDIEFNPKTSINCQARAAAIAVSLHRRGLLDEALSSKDAYLQLRENVPEHPSSPGTIDSTDGSANHIQGDLFET